MFLNNEIHVNEKLKSVPDIMYFSVPLFDLPSLTKYQFNFSAYSSVLSPDKVTKSCVSLHFGVIEIGATSREKLSLGFSTR